MSPDTLNILLSAGAALTGAVIGAGATLIASSQAAKREHQRELAREGRASARAAAEECDTLFSQLERDMLLELRSTDDKPDELAVRIESADRNAWAKAAHLPPEVRSRISQALELLGWASEIGWTRSSPGFHYAFAGAVIRDTCADAHAVLAAFLGYEGQLPERSPVLSEYAVALEMAREYADDTHPDQVEDLERRKRAWYERHPPKTDAEVPGASK